MTLVAVAVKPFTVVEVEQRSPEWFESRLGLLTGSQAHAVVAKGRNAHEESVMRRNLRIRLALERETGRWIPDGTQQTPAMAAGVEREPLALAAYEALTGELVQRAGFLAHRTHRAGCSPDGYLGTFDTIISIKCRQPAAHYDFLRTSVIPPDALAQIRHELWVTEAAAMDYFCWNPEFPEALQSKLVRVTAAQVDVSGYEVEALKFLAEVDAEVAALQHLAEETSDALSKA